MPTYSDAISRLNQKLRDFEAWPNDSSKVDEQLWLLHNAVIAVLKGVPLERLAKEPSPAFVDDDSGHPNIKRFEFPADTFWFRDDMGISAFYLDGTIHYKTQAIPPESLFMIADNLLHKHRVLFGFDRAERALFASNTDEVKANRFAVPPPPSEVEDSFPIVYGNDFEVATTIVAAHVTGETIRDNEQPAFQAFLARIYGDDVNEPS